MELERADVVKSLRGRDTGEMFFVLESDGVYALIADGKGRRIEKPKKKKLRHLEFIGRSYDRTDQKLRAGEKVTNSELRRALADKAGNEEKGGTRNGEG